VREHLLAVPGVVEAGVEPGRVRVRPGASMG